MKKILKSPINFESKNSTNSTQSNLSQINPIPQTKSIPSKTSLFTPISFSLSSLLLSASIGSLLSAIDVSYQSHIKPSQTAIDAVRHRGNNAPRVTQANNGVPIVDIANPNKAGISNNYFQDFNVSKDGLIFNNSKDLFTNTTLAGYINGNSNLTNEASLILGQVTGSNPSSLLGVMEIAGKKADLIIANPNGITCSNCGVLNVKSFTLSTGSISQDELDRVANSSQLKQTLTMMTERGHINIEALNASNVSKLNIIAQSASVNGALYAQDLQMILGANKITFDLNNQSDASLLLYEPIALKAQDGSTENKLALDVSHLGSVVANSIYLVATEEGVGVKNSGSMATIGSKEKGDGGFVIDVNGTITISTPEKGKSTLDQTHTSPSMISSNDLTIRAKKLVNGSIISADNDISITADEILNQARYEKSEVVVSHHKGKKIWYLPWFTNGWLQWKYSEEIVTEERIRFDTFSPAIIRSGKNLTLKATNIKNDMGTIEAGAKATFESKNKFENNAPMLKRRVKKTERRKTYNDGGRTYVIDDHYEDIKAILPQFNAQDLILANQESILKNTLDHINNLHFTQEDRAEFTKLDSFLSTQSFQDYLKTQASLHPTVIKQQFEQAKELDRLKSQQAQIQISLEESLKHRLNQIQEDRSKIDPNDFSHIGIKAQDLTIEAGEITNSSLIEAGYTTLVGESIINENGIIASKQDLNIQAKDFKNLGADLIAGNDLKIKADNVEIGVQALVTNKDDAANSSTTNIVSNLLAGNISIDAKNDANFTSANMQAGNDLKINAGGNVKFDTAEEVRSTNSISVDGKIDWDKTTATTTITTTITKTNIANSLKGNNISITAGKNLTGYNVSAEAKENLSMNAGNDLLLSTKADTTHIVEEKREESFGFFGHEEKTPIREMWGVSFGTKTTITTTTTDIATHNNQTLSANKISLEAGNSAKLESINTDSKEIEIKGKDVTITALSDSHKEDIHKVSTQKTFGIGVSTNTNAWGANVGMGYEERQTTTDKNSHKETTSSSNINADNIKISAEKTIKDKNGNEKVVLGQVNIIGSNLSGSDIALTGKEVNIKTHQTINKTTESENTEIKHRGGLNLLGFGGGNFATTGIYGMVEAIAGINPSDKNTDFSYSKINTGSTITGDNITISTLKPDGKPAGNVNITGSTLTATNQTNITAKNVNIKGSQDTYINGGYGFKYNALVGVNLPSILDVEAYAQANGSASLNTHNNNSAISSGTINITTSYAPKEVQDGSKVDWNKAFKNQEKIKEKAKAIKTTWDELQEAKKTNDPVSIFLKKAGFAASLAYFGVSLLKNADKKTINNNLNLIYNANNGNINLAGANLKGNNVNLNSANNLTIKTQKEIHANINAGMNVTAESIGSALVAIPIDFRGNIENGQSEKELKDALQINLSSSSAKQTDIQAENLTINTTNQTTLSGSHIQSQNGNISTNTLVEKELTHKGFEVAQRLDDGRDMWGKYGSPNKGVITGEGSWELLYKLLSKTKITIHDIDRIAKLGDFKLDGKMSFSQATHKATISPSINITTKNPSASITKGEAQTQSSMQITKTENRNTDIKTLIQDTINAKKTLTKVKEDTETFIQDVDSVKDKVIAIIKPFFPKPKESK